LAGEVLFLAVTAGDPVNSVVDGSFGPSLLIISGYYKGV